MPNCKFSFDLQSGNVEGQGKTYELQWIELIKAYMHVKFKVMVKFSHKGPKHKLAFDLETGNFKGQCQKQWTQ